jgi:RHS repeat-associated protein
MTYTIDGQIATITDGRGITNFDYDAQNRLLSRIDADGSTISYTYDKTGNRTSVTIQILNGNTNTTNYSFDERDRLDKVLSGNTILTDYDYDAVNNLIQTTLSNGTIETRQYDKLNRLTNLQTDKNNNILTNFTYTLDKVGHRQQVVETIGNNTRTINYTYDNLYRLTEEEVIDAINGNRTTEFSYDKVGNRLQQKVTANNTVITTVYEYDVNDRLLKERVNGVDKVIYTYDDNGNTLTKTENGQTTQSIWNEQNRLVEVRVQETDNSVTQQVEYEYDASGIRVSQSVDGEITKYLIDANLPYAQVLAEYRPSGLVVVSYAHGNDLINQNRDGESSFYHVDGLGSTRALSDGGGNLIDTYSYQAFGELLNSSGGSENNYLFAGEQFDPVLGDYYNRARYYDPQTGRFTKRDDYEGKLEEPVTLHKYLYANANPVSFIDPLGLFSLNELTLANLSVSSIAALELFVLYQTVPGLIAGLDAPSTSSSDDVLVYVGFSPKYPLGHAFIAVDGMAYTYSGGDPEVKPEQEYVLSEITHNGYFFYKYSIKYSDFKKQQLINNLQNLRQTYSNTPYTLLNLFRIRKDDAYLTGSDAHNCTTFVADSFPSSGAVFDIVVKSAFYPSGLGVGLDLVDIFSRSQLVQRLSDI